MTAKASTSNFLTNFKYKVKSNSRIMIIVFILHLMAAPLNLIYLIYYQLERVKWDKMVMTNQVISAGSVTVGRSPSINMMYPVIGLLCTGLAVLAGVLLAVNIYNYLYKRSVVDMTLSLPLTTDQRFFSDFLAGLFTYLAPFVVSSIITLIINGIAGRIVPSWPSWAEDSTISVTQTLLNLIIFGFFVMLMVYVLTVLVLSCCGSLFETLAYTVLINGLIPGTIAVFGYILLGNLFGIDLSSNIIPVIEKTSPIGAFIGIYYNAEQFGSPPFVLRLWPWLVPFVMVTFLYFCAAFFLYKRRKAEQVSRPFVYKAFYFIIITSMTFCIGTLFTLDGMEDNFIPLIIITAVIYLIFEVVTNRGFRKFYKSVIRYVVTMVAVIGMAEGFTHFEGFGAVQRIPSSADEVQSVDLGGYGGIFERYDDGSVYSYSDPKNIEAILNMHRAVLDDYNAEKETDYSNDLEEASFATYYFEHATLKYHLKNGQSYTREYSLNLNQMLKLLPLDGTEEFKTNKIKMIENQIKTYSSSSLSLTDALDLNNRTEIRETVAPEMIQALTEDIKALPLEEYLTPSSDTLCYLQTSSRYLSRIALNENYPNTLMFLKKYGIKIPSANSSSDLENYVGYKNIFLFKPEDAKVTVNGTDYYYSSTGSYIDYPDDTVATPAYTEELMTLLTHARSEYLTTTPCYLLVLNGDGYIVPPEYSELAEKIYTNSDKRDNTADESVSENVDTATELPAAS